jgi:hypothetical protein
MPKRKYPPVLVVYCLDHRPDHLGYAAASEDADERLANGEEQRFCPDCERWLWRHEWAAHEGWERAVAPEKEKQA